MAGDLAPPKRTADPVYVNVDDVAEGAGLVRALRLTAGLVRTQASWQVEIRSPREDPRTFLADVGVALAAWSGRWETAAAARQRWPATEEVRRARASTRTGERDASGREGGRT